MKSSKSLSLLATLLLAVLLLVSCSEPTQGNYVPPVNGNNTVPSWKSDPEAEKFVNEIGGCSETYTGSVSEEDYSSAAEAAEAYVSREIISAESGYSIGNISLEKTLEKNEIKAAGIPDSLTANATRVEKYNVEYTETDDSASAASMISLSANTNSNSVTVYIICYANMYKYFSPVVTNGNTLTRSYYDSIFNSEKYKNCTVNSSVTVSVHVEYLSETIEYTMTTESTIMYDNGRIYMTQTVTSTNESIIPSRNMTVYFENDEYGSLDCYILQDGVWQAAYLSSIGNLFNFSSIDDLMPFAQSYIDHSYFTKTDYGCKIEKENLGKYVTVAFDLAFDQLLGTGTDNMQSDGFLDYYVSDGVLSGTRSNISLSFNVSGVSCTEKITSQEKCTNYGTTVVESPINNEN